MTTEAPFNTESWQAAQQQFVHNFFKLQKDTWQTFAAQKAWQETFDSAWQNLNKATSLNPSSELSQKLFQQFLQQTQSYVQLQENFLHKLQDLTAFSNNENLWKSWAHYLQQQMQQISQANLLDNWQLLGDEFLQNMQTQVARLQDLQAQQPEDWQARWQRSQELWQAYQEAQKAYMEFFNHIGINAADLLQARLQQDSEHPTNDWRAAYDAWIDAGEEAYAQAINTEEYAEINARVINSLLQWKLHNRGLMNDLLATLNLPSYGDIQRLQAKIQHLQAQKRNTAEIEQVLELQEKLQLNEEQKQALQAEFDSLKTANSSEIEQLQKELASAQDSIKTLQQQAALVDDLQQQLEQAQAAVKAAEAKPKTAARKTSTPRKRKTPAKTTATADTSDTPA